MSVLLCADAVVLVLVSVLQWPKWLWVALAPVSWAALVLLGREMFRPRQRGTASSADFALAAGLTLAVLTSVASLATALSVIFTRWSRWP